MLQRDAVLKNSGYQRDVTDNGRKKETRVENSKGQMQNCRRCISHEYHYYRYYQRLPPFVHSLIVNNETFFHFPRTVISFETHNEYIRLIMHLKRMNSINDRVREVLKINPTDAIVHRCCDDRRNRKKKLKWHGADSA